MRTAVIGIYILLLGLVPAFLATWQREVKKNADAETAAKAAKDAGGSPAAAASAAAEAAASVKRAEGASAEEVAVAAASAATKAGGSPAESAAAAAPAVAETRLRVMRFTWIPPLCTWNDVHRDAGRSFCTTSASSPSWAVGFTIERLAVELEVEEHRQVTGVELALIVLDQSAVGWSAIACRIGSVAAGKKQQSRRRAAGPP